MSLKLKRMIAAFSLFIFVCLLGACAYWGPRLQKTQPAKPPATSGNAR